MSTPPRVPLPATVDLVGEARTIQVNHCRMPACENFGVPARHEPQKPGPSPDRDPAYKLHSTNKGQIPSLRCKACGDNPPVKSNASVGDEIRRLVDSGGLLAAEERTSCRDPHCRNHEISIAEGGKAAYRKRGRTRTHGGQRYQCKACGRLIEVTAPVRLHDRNKRLAADVLSRIANKSPARCSIRGSGVRSTQSYYTILRFIHERCRALSGSIDRALMDGRLTLPEEFVTQTDAQEYTLNWVSRLDRRNVVLSGYATIDADSHFVLGMHVNFDGRVDPFEVNRDAAQVGDFHVAEAFRKYAHYWLAGDELAAGRALSRKIKKHERVALIRQIQRLYANAQSRRDVEDIELDHHDPAYRQLPPLSTGMQTHEPYTAYAHWMLMHRMLTGAGVRHVQANMDQSSMSRAAFLCAFLDEVRRGDADAFFVRYTKFQTIDERESILQDAKRERERFREGLPPEIREDPREVARLMMKERIAAGQTYGKWNDIWIEHPEPTINEPHKAMSWLTARESLDEDRTADLFMNAGLARIDNLFMKSRRLFSALERPVGTSSGHNTVWHGYAPYNPRMLETYLTIFRTVNNFVFVGDDGATPAMRLGFAREPLRYEDILWPGQAVPRPKRERRKGRVVAIPS